MVLKSKDEEALRSYLQAHPVEEDQQEEAQKMVWVVDETEKEIFESIRADFSDHDIVFQPKENLFGGKAGYLVFDALAEAVTELDLDMDNIVLTYSGQTLVGDNPFDLPEDSPLKDLPTIALESLF